MEVDESAREVAQEPGYGCDTQCIIGASWIDVRRDVLVMRRVAARWIGDGHLKFLPRRERATE